jgi:hypothetical protein
VVRHDGATVGDFLCGDGRREGGDGEGEADDLQGFGFPVAGSVAVSPELDEPSAPFGSVAGRGDWPSRAGVRWFSFSVSRLSGRGSVIGCVLNGLEWQRPKDG